MFGGFFLLDLLWRFFVVLEDRDLDDPLFCFVPAFVSDTLGSTEGDSLKASLLSGRKLYSLAMILPSVGNLAPLLFYLNFPSLVKVALAERDFLPVSVVDFDTICRLTEFSYCLLIEIHTSL